MVGEPVIDESEPRAEAEGWAARSLERSVHAGLLLIIGLAQALLVYAALVAPETAGRRSWFVAAHVGIAVLAGLVHRGLIRLWMLLVAIDGMLFVEWTTSASHDGVLCFATAWMFNLASLPPSMLMRGRSRALFVAVVVVGMPIAVYLAHPDWLSAVVIAMIGTSSAMAWAGWMVMPGLRSLARRFDAEAEAAWRELRANAMVRAASIESAEQARTMHDTAINTLGAVASGGGATGDVVLVRSLCGRDLRTLERLLAGVELRPELDLDRMAAEVGLAVRRYGLDDADLRRVLGLLSDGVVRALAGAVREAFRNVAKHAGTGAVELSATADEHELVLTVLDRGSGFDGRIVPDRGLAESVLGRAATAGISVALDTEPGSGTQLRFACSLAPTSSSDAAEVTAPEEDYEEVVVAIRRRASWSLAGAVLVVGIVIELANHRGSPTATIGMLAVVALAIGVARTDVRRGGGPLSTGTCLLLVASVPAAFLFALAGVDFGHRNAIQWQAIGVSAPLILLIAHARTVVPAVVGFGVLVATSAVTTAVVAQGAPDEAAVIPVGTLLNLAVVGGWLLFERALERVGRRASEEQRVAAAARIEHAAREAASSARERWRQAGLQGCRSLLHALASGAADPADPEVRSACGAEEAYLRQVTLLDPELFRMGHWFARALAEARRAGVRLVVRSGEHEVEDDATAGALGGLLQEVVASVPAGSEITVTLFPTQGTLRFGLVGPSPIVGHLASRWTAPTGWDASVRSFAPVDIVEVTR